MRFLFLVLLGILPSLVASQNITVVKNRYIVEFDTTRDVLASFYESIRKEHPIFGLVDSHVNYTSDLFHGTSFTVSKDTDFETIKSVGNVKRIWPVHYIPLGVTPEWKGEEALAHVNWTSHVPTGVDKLHARGIKGRGAVVGVIDTGVDYTHPALGGGIGPGKQILGGYDFIGDGNWPFEDPTPDDDPRDQLGHGTHVTGIIIGSNNEHFTGVAPEASIRVYKVFGRYDLAAEDILIAATLRAYEDGVDIITASIGGRGGFSNTPWGVVSSRVVDQGVLVTIAAGNEGTGGGPFFFSNGAAGENVLAVASAENTQLVAYEAVLSFDNSEEATIGYLPAARLFPPEISDYPVVALSFDQSEPAEACQPYPEGTGDYSNSTVLVRRGTCTFAEKVANVEALGAKFILLYNNENPVVTPSIVTQYSSTVALITAETGAKIIEELQKGSIVVLTPKGDSTVGLDDNFYGGKPSTFTSWGPLYDLNLKPEIAAPGGKIFSTYPGGYAVQSGTSMATPYIAGVAALYVGVHGGRSRHGKSFGKELGRRLVTSGYALPWGDGLGGSYDLTASTAQVGNGMINALKVVTYTTSVDTLKINLNDTAHFHATHTITVTNHGFLPTSYTFSVEDNALIETLNDRERNKFFKAFTDFNTNPLTAKTEVDFSPKVLTVFPGRSAKFTATFHVPEGLNPSVLPLYSGRVIIKAFVTGEVLSIPFLGLAADLKEDLGSQFTINSLGQSFPWSPSGLSRFNIMRKPWWTFDLNIQDFPIIYWNNRFGTEEVRLDIYEAGYTESQWEYPPVVGQNGYIGAGTTYLGLRLGQPQWTEADDKTNVGPFPIYDILRIAPALTSYHEDWWIGSLANGSDLGNGQYHLRFAVLKPFGDRTVAKDWSVWENGMPDIVTVNRTISA